MPDGYSVDLDQFHGLDQIGEEGMKDKVNNHYLQIFGTSIALGVIAGAGVDHPGRRNDLHQRFSGVHDRSGRQAFPSPRPPCSTDLFKYPPTITIREGHRIKIYFTQDMLLPAYENHTIPQTF